MSKCDVFFNCYIQYIGALIPLNGKRDITLMEYLSSKVQISSLYNMQCNINRPLHVLLVILSSKITDISSKNDSLIDKIPYQACVFFT